MLLQLGQVDDDLLVVGKEPVVVLEELAVIARELHVVGEQLLVIHAARACRAPGRVWLLFRGGISRVALHDWCSIFQRMRWRARFELSVAVDQLLVVCHQELVVRNNLVKLLQQRLHLPSQPVIVCLQALQ